MLSATTPSSLMAEVAERQNSDNDAVQRRYNIVIQIYVVGMLCALGIVANVLSIVVLGRDRTIRRTTGFMLQMLAVADVFYLMASVFYQTLNRVYQSTDWLPGAVRRRWPYVACGMWPVASVAQTATVWLVVVVTADRYVAICRPLHAAHYSTVRRVRRAVAAVWVTAVVYNLPRFFERVVVPVDAAAVALGVNASSLEVTGASTISTVSATSPEFDTGRVEVRHSTLRGDPVYFLVYKTCLFFVVRFLLPFAALAFFNQRLVQAMRASAEHVRRYGHHSGGNGGGGSGRGGGGKERQHTRTLFVVVVVFVACELPDLVLRAWIAVHDHAPRYVAFPLRTLRYVNTAGNLLLVVNSCVNFVIYCFMGRRFRAILLRMLRCETDAGDRPRTDDAGGRRRCCITARPSIACLSRHSSSQADDSRPSSRHRLQSADQTTRETRDSLQAPLPPFDQHDEEIIDDDGDGDADGPVQIGNSTRV